MIRFQDAGPPAAAAIAALMARAFDPRFGEAWNEAQVLAAMALPGCTLELADNDALVGFTLTRRVLDEVELLLCAVSPTSRRCGLGTMMVRRVLDRSFALQVRQLFLEVREGNTAATALYSSMGFRPVGRRARYYAGSDGVRHDAITMRCTLDFD